MIDIELYMDNLIQLLIRNFSKRLLYVGLQGSYLRNEANENSDIDVMVILDNISVDDLDIYKKVLISTGNYDKSCGFICGKSEINSWNPLEICHLVHSTKNYYGKLEDFIPSYTLEDERNFIKLSINNIYHEICHRYIHSGRDENIAKLPITYKYVFFIIQNINYLNTGTFIATKDELIDYVQNDDKEVLKMAVTLRNNTDYDFDNAFNLLFEWCQKAISLI